MDSLDQLWKGLAAGELGPLDQFLASGGDVNVLDPRTGWTLLCTACEHQHYPAMEALAERGADLNLASGGMTPLEHALDIDIDSGTDELHTVWLLLHLGANPGPSTRDWLAESYPGYLPVYDELVARRV